MTSRERRRPAVRTVLVLCSAALVALPVGVGTASAADHRPSRWKWWGKPRPSATAVRPSPTASPTSRPPTRPATPTPTASPTSRQTATPKPPSGTGKYTLPPANGGFDYQIGGAYQPPAGVDIVSRDHAEAAAAGKYNVCYVNGFQTQTEDAEWWRANHNDLLLRRGGKEVVDSDWNEILLDTSTAAKRTALSAIVGDWIDECVDRGYQAVEVDNLDSYTRSEDLLTVEDALAYARLLADHAHARGLAIAQKNTVELDSAGRDRAGFDFVVAEECAVWDECQGYVDVYGKQVIVIEYSDASFQKACSRFGSTLSIVRRDRNVTKPGQSTYKFKIC